MQKLCREKKKICHIHSSDTLCQDLMFLSFCSRKNFSSLHKNYQELVEALYKLTVEIHNNYMATSVLHDMESYNWKDSKEFQEVPILPVHHNCSLMNYETAVLWIMKLQSYELWDMKHNFEANANGNYNIILLMYMYNLIVHVFANSNNQKNKYFCFKCSVYNPMYMFIFTLICDVTTGRAVLLPCTDVELPHAWTLSRFMEHVSASYVAGYI